jgi:hypothetical protein
MVAKLMLEVTDGVIALSSMSPGFELEGPSNEGVGDRLALGAFRAHGLHSLRCGG